MSRSPGRQCVGASARRTSAVPRGGHLRRVAPRCSGQAFSRPAQALHQGHRQRQSHERARCGKSWPRYGSPRLSPHSGRRTHRARRSSVATGVGVHAQPLPGVEADRHGRVRVPCPRLSREIAPVPELSRSSIAFHVPRAHNREAGVTRSHNGRRVGAGSRSPKCLPCHFQRMKGQDTRATPGTTATVSPDASHCRREVQADVPGSR